MMKQNTTMMRTAAANIPRYVVYTALKGVGFGLFLPIWVIYLQQQRGLSLAQATLVDVTFFVAAALAELPTGIIADRFGRTTSMTIGASLMAAGLIGWTFAPTLLLTIVAYVAMGVGMTFLSGAENAFFYETVRASGRGDGYPRLLGRVSAIFPGSLALGSVASGFLAAINVILPFILSGLLLLAALGIVLTLSEPHTEQQSHEQARPSLRAVLEQSLAVLRTRPTLRFSVDAAMGVMTIERLNVLRSVSIFEGTSDEVLAEISAVLEEPRFQAGARIFSKGDLGDCLYVIPEGHVRVHDGERTLSTLQRGEVLARWPHSIPNCAAPRSPPSPTRGCCVSTVGRSTG
jgi:MFS family permease